MPERDAYPLILMYHHIAPPPAGARIKGMYVTPGQFDWQLGWLKRRGYEFSTFADLDAPSDGRRIIITLDDGYLNNYTEAFPILQKHGARAVIYPIQADLGKSGVSWPGATEQTPADMMDPDQAREMAAAGIEFGSHLLHHKRLTEMTPEEQVLELEQSRALLEAMLDKPVLSIAYPYGAYDDSVIEVTRAAGYRYGVTTDPGTNPVATDPLRLNRFTAKGCKLYHPLKFRRMIFAAERQAIER
ncbi:MAG: polysaccharide deacetylase family protein [Gammaproteobacteria bacterium]|nr:MAG: polysaccharide deacetylase family protein [Gammaproteobacteria bacterium]